MNMMNQPAPFNISTPTQKLKSEPKKLLLEALRNPENKQIQGFLETSEGNCCLGLACRVFDKVNPGVLEIEKYSQDTKPTTFNGAVGILPEVVQAWFWFETIEGSKVEITENIYSLMWHNDTGATFLQIADAIEEQL